MSCNCEKKNQQGTHNNTRGIGQGPLGSDHRFDDGNVESGFVNDYDQGDPAIVSAFKKAKKI